MLSSHQDAIYPILLPGINCGIPTLNPIAESFAIASRRELLSMTSGKVMVGDLEALIVR